MANRSIVYQDEDVVVTADVRGEAPAAIVSFSSFEASRAPVPFGDGFIQSLGLSAIFVTATSNHWWQIPTHHTLCAAVAAVAARFPVRIGYGSSMGGYGALLFGRPMGCTRVIALAPQTVLNDSVARLSPLHRSWVDRRPILHDRIADELKDLVPEIAFDPHHGSDQRHVDYLRARHAVRLMPYPFAGHLVLRTLHKLGLLRDTVSAWSLNPAVADAFIARYEASRHLSPIVGRNIARWDARRQGDAHGVVALPGQPAPGSGRTS